MVSELRQCSNPKQKIMKKMHKRGKNDVQEKKS